MRKIFGLILLTPTTIAQMGAVTFDVSYSGKNDRFDQTSIMRAHNKMNRDTLLADDDEEAASDAEYHRKIHKEGTETLIDAIQRKQVQNISLRRADDAFAEDDRFNSYEGGSVSQFEENLKKFTVKPSSKSTVNDDEEFTETSAVSSLNDDEENSAVPSQNDASTVADVTDVDVPSGNLMQTTE